MDDDYIVPEGLISVEQAIASFGLVDEPDPVTELERIVLEYDLDADVDDDGNLLAIDADIREAVFEEHRKKVGYRPDDPVAQEKERKREEAERAKAKARRKARREKLRRKHDGGA